MAQWLEDCIVNLQVMDSNLGYTGLSNFSTGVISLFYVPGVTSIGAKQSTQSLIQ